MSFQIETEKVLAWNRESQKMEPATTVLVKLVGGNGGAMAEAGPLYCRTGKDIWEAQEQLKEEIVRYLESIAINF
jgi:hypothetical protein